MILRAKKYVAALLVFICVCMMFSPLTAYAAEDSSQHETVKVGFFAMDGYHVMDEEGNRSGYGYDFLRLEHLSHFDVRAAVLRSFQRCHRSRDRRICIRSR